MTCFLPGARCLYCETYLPINVEPSCEFRAYSWYMNRSPEENLGRYLDPAMPETWSYVHDGTEGIYKDGKFEGGKIPPRSTHLFPILGAAVLGFALAYLFQGRGKSSSTMNDRLKELVSALGSTGQDVSNYANKTCGGALSRIEHALGTVRNRLKF